MKVLHGRFRAWHEKVDARLKIFNIIGKSFRHNVSLHGTVFYVVVTFTEIMINTGDPMFPIH